MKRGTGKIFSLTEELAKEYLLSIQFALDGLSFAVGDVRGEVLSYGRHAFHPGEEACAAMERLRETVPLFRFRYKELRVVADTDRVSWIPESFFDREQAKYFMRAVSVVKEAGEKTAVCRLLPDTVGVLYVPARLHRYLKEHYAAVRYGHPLLYNFLRRYADPEIVLNLTDRYAHITVWHDGRMPVAETFPLGSAADLLFYIEKIKGAFAGASFRIVLAGTRAGEWKKQLSGFLKNIRAERDFAGCLPNRKKEDDPGAYNNHVAILGMLLKK